MACFNIDLFSTEYRMSFLKLSMTLLLKMDEELKVYVSIHDGYELFLFDN